MIFRSSHARMRLFLILWSLFLIVVLSVVIMGIIGVNGHITFQSLESGCILFMSKDGDVVSFNNGYCLFPIIGSAIHSLIALFFLAYLAMVLRRRDDFTPKPFSIGILIISGLMALFAFAICAEVGIGLNKGCKLTGVERGQCLQHKNFSALYGAQVSAGLMGGFWLWVLILEWVQFKRRPGLLSGHVDHLEQTTVVPHSRSASRQV